MADLKQRLAPLEDMDMPERWNEIRQRAPRAEVARGALYYDRIATARD